MRAAKDQASLHIRTVSPEPLLMHLKEGMLMNAHGQIVHYHFM